MLKINNDDLNVANVTQKPAVEKVSNVEKVSSSYDHPAGGNYYPPGAATSQRSIELPLATGAEKLDVAVQELNEYMQVVQRELHFSVDKDSGHTVIKVMDLATKEVIRQIPNEEALNIASKLAEGVDMKLFSEYI